LELKSLTSIVSTSGGSIGVAVETAGCEISERHCRGRRMLLNLRILIRILRIRKFSTRAAASKLLHACMTAGYRFGAAHRIMLCHAMHAHDSIQINALPYFHPLISGIHMNRMDNIDEFRKFLLTQDPITTATAYWIIYTGYGGTRKLESHKVY
jgi:hypothetical protein